jgi:threonine synthase
MKLLQEVSMLTHIKALKCRECGREYAPTKIYVCEDCFGPLDVVYNYNSINIDKKELRDKPKTVWRYFELLPIENPSNIVDLGAGYTIMHRANTLARALGLKEVYVKDDTVNPTYSFKDRPATVAVSKAVEFGSKAVGCASTGNLAAATAAHAAKAGLPCYIFIPASIELNKIVQATAYGANIIAVKGTYDDANVLAAQAAELYDWAFVNINIRPYYVEGSKTLAFETCEQLDWNPPDHVIVPVASGALLGAIFRGFDEFRKLGLIENSKIRVTGAQPHGCSPVVDAFKSNSDEISPVEQPDTIAKSLAVGNPGDGVYAVRNIRETGGVAESATNEEIVEAIKLLAKTEGIFTEPAGGVTIAVLKKLVKSGVVSTDEKIVCYVTGNGLKAPESILEHVPKPIEIEASLESLTTLSTLGGA